MATSNHSLVGNQRLKVMTFNIRNGRANDGDNCWENRRDNAAELIRSQRVDLVGIQEAFRYQVDDLLGRLPDFSEIGVGRDDGKDEGEHCQILFLRDRFHPSDHGTFWLSDTPDAPGSTSWGNRTTRICTWARLTDRSNNMAFYVYNLHLDHESQQSRERSAKFLMDRIRNTRQPDPVLLMGDFNADEENPAIRLLQSDSSLRDTFRACRPDEKESGTFHGFTGDKRGGKIDYIFASKELDVRDSRILRDSEGDRYPSDHFPVVADLAW